MPNKRKLESILLVFPIYTKLVDPCPRVQLILSGKRAEFVLDTTSPLTFITKSQAWKWGKIDKLLPSTVKGSLGRLSPRLQLDKFGHEENIEVMDFGENVLGIDILSRYNCVINFRKKELIFRSRYRRDDRRFCYMNVIVNGKGLRVVLDTGSPGFLVGPPSVAERLRLPMRIVNEEDREYRRRNSVTEILQDAKVTISALGRSKTGSFIVHPAQKNDTTAQLGSSFLRGSIIVFNFDGSFSAKFPKK